MAASPLASGAGFGCSSAGRAIGARSTALSALSGLSASGSKSAFCSGMMEQRPATSSSVKGNCSCLRRLLEVLLRWTSLQLGKYRFVSYSSFSSRKGQLGLAVEVQTVLAACHCQVTVTLGKLAGQSGIGNVPVTQAPSL